MGVGEQLAVSLVVRVDAGQHVSKQPSQRVHVRSGVGLCESELLWGSETVGAQCRGVVRRIRRDGPGDAEVDQMRSVVGDNHVGWGDVPMDDAMPVQLGHGIAQLADQLCRRALRKFSLLLNDVLQRPPRYVVIHHHEMIGQLVCCLDVWQAWVRAGAESRPYVALGQLGWDLLAHERTDAVDADQFGEAALTASERALDAVGVVDPHRVRGLPIVHLAPQSWSLPAILTRSRSTCSMA